MTRQNDKGFWVGTLVLLAALWGELALAQSQRVIEEIVVTAQKTEESLQDVPISVTALSGDFLQENGIGDLVEVSQFVPNVRVEFTSPSSPQVFIRGFGTNTFNPSFEPAVGLVQDEIFYGRGTYFTQSMYDLARVEVLRGPQGTLFGKNTIAGVFSASTRDAPQALGSEGNLLYKHEQFADQRLEAGIGYRASDTFGLRVSALGWTRDGRMRNTKLGRKEDTKQQDALRLKMQWEPLDQGSLQLIAQNSATKVNFWPRQLMALDQDTYDYLVNFDEQLEDDPLNFQTSFNTPGELYQASDSVSLKGDYDFGSAIGLEQLSSTAIVGVSWLEVEQYQDLDVSPADLLILDEVDDYRQHSLEWRFNGSANSLFGLGEGARFIAGAYYFESYFRIIADVIGGQDLGSYASTKDAQQLISGDSNAPGNPFGGTIGGVAPQVVDLVNETDYYRFDYIQDTAAYALFGQLTWDLTERWVLAPGIRLNREVKASTPTGTGVCTNKEIAPVPESCITPTVMGANDYAPGTIHRVEENISPKISLTYYLSDQINVYTSWTRGFKSGGVNAISFTGEGLEFEPERAQSIELGLRSQLFDNTMKFNATIYRMDFDDLQVLAFNGLLFDVTNAAAAYSEGVEADLQWLTPYTPLSLYASAGYLRARYKRYPSAPAPVSEGIGALQDLSGQTLAFAPEITATISPTLEYTVAGFPLKIGANIHFRDEHFTDTDLDPATRIPATTTYSATIAISSQDETCNFVLGGKNLSDERTLNQVIDTAMFPGTYNPSQNPGRVVYGSIGCRW